MTTAARTVSATAMTGAVLILLGAEVVISRSRPDEPPITRAARHHASLPGPGAAARPGRAGSASYSAG
jgi:hypothetical protein